MSEIKDTIEEIFERYEKYEKKCVILTTEDYKSYMDYLKSNNLISPVAPLKGEFIPTYNGVNIYRDDTFGNSFMCSETAYAELLKMKKKSEERSTFFGTCI